MLIVAKGLAFLTAAQQGMLTSATLSYIALGTVVALSWRIYPSTSLRGWNTASCRPKAAGPHSPHTIGVTAVNLEHYVVEAPIGEIKHVGSSRVQAEG